MIAQSCSPPSVTPIASPSGLTGGSNTPLNGGHNNRAALSSPSSVATASSSSDAPSPWYEGRLSATGTPIEFQPHARRKGGKVRGADRRAVDKWQLQDTACEILPEWNALRSCNRRPLDGDVSVIRGPGGLRFGGLERCNLVWCCPVCAPRISAIRRDELRRAVKVNAQTSGDVCLVTLTFPHYAGQSLKSLRRKFNQALRNMNQARRLKALMEGIGCRGKIRAIELTWGRKNGWHPHAHILLFYDRANLINTYLLATELQQDALLAYLNVQIYELWQAACTRAGLPMPSADHGVDVRNADYAADYVAKWGAAEELTLSHLKYSKGESCSPLDLLEAAAGDGIEGEAARLWREYAYAIKGQKQLHWSKGLRKLLQLGEEVADDDQADGDQQQEEVVGRIGWADWGNVIRAGARGPLLAAAEQGWEHAERLLALLRECFPAARPWVIFNTS